MKLGFFTMPIHPLDKDWRTSLREDREAFILADQLGFTEGYVGEHATDQAENITSCAVFIASLIDATKTIKLGTGTINMPNSHPAAAAAQIAMLDHMLDGRFIFGISPGGLLSDAEAFGNLDADRNAMFLEAINHGAGDLGRRAALRHRGQVLERSRSNGSHAGDRAGLPAEAVAEAASADRRDGGGAVLQGRDRSRGARLGPDLGELPDAGMGEEPLAEIRRGLRARRAQGRSGELARRQEHFRRRRRQDREGLCHRSEQPVSLLLQPALHQAEEGPARTVQDAARPARQRGDARRHLQRADHPRLAGQGRRRDSEIPRAGRRFRHAALRRQGLARSGAGQALDDAAGREGDAQGQRGAIKPKAKSRP